MREREGEILFLCPCADCGDPEALVPAVVDDNYFTPHKALLTDEIVFF